ncbi:hypothetical protein BAE44_0016419 [Dichanthelium oligosanthes]|uniref:Uncharacterized protein n=1 Tax=Dichanthelium oligosanthes TaxID=888268 RepID=A0A1E5VBN2_9POAL|nr:hypothetical protein BAE44_0016419 [Dichanthelium oligosanthes]
MVIIRATVTSRAGARSTWQRRLEDEVAPEFGGLQLAGAGEGNLALDKNRPGCLKGGQCNGKPDGGSYVRPCTYNDQARGC